MPGFFLCSEPNDTVLNDRYPEKCVSGKLDMRESGTVLRRTLNKFMDDKAFFVSDRIAVVTEGYLLNKHELFATYKVSTVASLVEAMIYKDGELCEDFFKDFRGCFSGAVYIRNENRWIVYTNQIGDNPVFYYCRNGIFAAGSQVNYLLDFCKGNELLLTYNECAAYQMMTFAFMAGDDTYANEIRRLHGGDYLVFHDGQLEVKTYHRFEKHPDHFHGKNEDDIIEEIDRLFCQAVRLEWAKDNEYGYKHIADLSGGLDSRMNLWIAHELMGQKALVLTFSKAGEPDEKIAGKIARRLQDDYIFSPLDDCEFMLDIDENTEMLGGLSLYSGITGGNRLLKKLDLNQYGIEHSGQVGDIILASFYHSYKDMSERKPTGRYSEIMTDRLPEQIVRLPERYSDYEIYLMYSRGFHGACNTHLLRRNYTEIASPFLYVDFMQLCYDIPDELRMNHYIYRKWIIKKHPGAAAFKWEKLGGRITESRARYLVREIKKKGRRKALKLLGIRLQNKHGMNPLDYMLSKKPEILDIMNCYAKEGLHNSRSLFSAKLYHDIEWLYQNGSILEKSMALTVLASARLYFGDISNG